MKNIILLLLCLSYANDVPAQIKQAQHKRNNITQKYDSLLNQLFTNELELYIGQKFFVPEKSEHLREFGFAYFKKDIKGNTYKPQKKYSKQTAYEAVAGKYFNVIGVERNPKAYINDVYLILEEEGTANILYYDFKEHSFPFIVVGHYEKMKEYVVGRDFFIRYDIENSKRGCDLIVDDGSLPSLTVVFEDGTTYPLTAAIKETGDNLKIIEELEKREYIKQNLQIGIRANECQEICGEPDKINVTEGEWGVHEQWVYPDKYIYIKNGIVSSFQYEK